MSIPNNDGLSKKEKFLQAYAYVGNVTSAAKVAGCARQAHYQWLKEDPEYPALFEDAKEQAADACEQEIVRRAIQGIDEPVFGTVYDSKGRPIKKDVVGHIRKYSDLLLIFWAKALRPEKFMELRAVEHSGDLLRSIEIILPKEESGGNGDGES